MNIEFSASPFVFGVVLFGVSLINHAQAEEPFTLGCKLYAEPSYQIHRSPIPSGEEVFSIFPDEQMYYVWTGFGASTDTRWNYLFSIDDESIWLGVMVHELYPEWRWRHSTINRWTGAWEVFLPDYDREQAEWYVGECKKLLFKAPPTAPPSNQDSEKLF